MLEQKNVIDLADALYTEEIGCSGMVAGSVKSCLRSLTTHQRMEIRTRLLMIYSQHPYDEEDAKAFIDSKVYKILSEE
jgi:hypothetical protein